MTLRKRPSTCSDVLARDYLEILAETQGSRGRPMLRLPLRADLAAAAVLTARAIESARGLTRRLRCGAPVVVISTMLPGLVSTVLEECAFGSDATIMSSAVFGGRHARPVLLIARDGTSSNHKPEKHNEVIATALHVGAPVVGIAPEPRKHLPRDLLFACEYDLTLPELDVSALCLVLEVVTGERPKRLPAAQLVTACEISDLPLAIRADRNADGCLERLARIIGRKRLLLQDGPSLAELSGYGEAKTWGMKLAADLKDYRAGRLPWSEIEKGLLLAGPSGTGKTSFARALAKQANVPIVATSVADWNAAAYLSGTLSAMKAAFAQAKRLAPSIIFIDEVDGIGDRSKIGNEYREYWLQVVNLLLELLAGIEDRPGVVVIAATNDPDAIDPAVRRAGRLDRTIHIELPSVDDLVSIFRFHLNSALAGEDLTPVALAAQGSTGADVEAWTRRARSRARRAGRPLSMDDLLAEIRSGRAPLSPDLRRKVAIHEIGHLVAGLALQVFEANAVAIMDEGGVTNATLLPECQHTLRGLENLIAMLLAGRAAEELLLAPGETTAGAGNGENSDFARATEIAAQIETKLGFGIFGPMQLSGRLAELALQNPEVLAAVKRRLDRCMDRARATVSANAEAVAALSEHLAQAGYIGRDAIADFVRAYPLFAPNSPSAQEKDRGAC